MKFKQFHGISLESTLRYKYQKYIGDLKGSKEYQRGFDGFQRDFEVIQRDFEVI